jgi:plasmid stabilization system protein ParE
MKLAVRLLPEARAEFNEAADWYEQRRPGLGVDFIARVREAIARVASNPRAHAMIYDDARKAAVAKFPYVLIYREEPGEVIVISVFHTSRDPGIWQSRV